MKYIPRGLRRAFWAVVLASAAGGAILIALRVARSMERGRGAVFSLPGSEAPAPQRAERDFLARWRDGRYTGPSADEAWESLRLGPGSAPRRAAEGERRVAVTLSEGGRDVARRALHLASGGRAEFRFTVPAGGILSFEAGAKSDAGGKFEMAVEIIGPSGTSEALDFHRTVFVRNFSVDKKTPSGGLEIGWRRVEADLSPWAGKEVSLVFRAAFQPGPNEPSGSAAHAFWASPVLWVREPPLAAPPPRRMGATPSAPRPPENVLWVVFESFPAPFLRPDGLEDYPGLDFLAREGVFFQNVYTNRTDAEGGLRRLLTGRLLDVSAGPVRSGRSRSGANDGSRPFPAVLRDAGYRTVLLGAPAGDPALWTDEGFDAVFASPPSGPGGERVLREAARWMAEDGGRGPHFLMVFVRVPTEEEDPSPRCWVRAARLSPGLLFQGRRWRATAQAVQMDGALERLWSQVLRLGRDGRALLTVTSLRGKSFRAEPLRRLDDGRLFHGVLREPGWGLREEEVRALWLMRHARLGFGKKVTAPAQLLDAAPTILELMGLRAERGMEGYSFSGKDAASGRAESGARFVIEGAGGDALVLDGHYKYIRRSPPRETNVSGKRVLTDFEPEELYDLWTDPKERRNLARGRRDLLARARRAVNEHRPERTAVRLVFQGFLSPPLQGMANSPGGDLWNVSLSTGHLVRNGPNQVSFTVSAPEADFSFETWPPPAFYSLVLRAPWGVPADAFLVSRLGLPLVEAEKRTEWFDSNKFPWMDGFPSVDAPGNRPRIYMGRVPVRENAP